jgi:hypothetical protein
MKWKADCIYQYIIHTLHHNVDKGADRHETVNALTTYPIQINCISFFRSNDVQKNDLFQNAIFTHITYTFL